MTATYLIPVVYLVTGDDPTHAWERFAQDLDDDRAMFCGSPRVAPTGEIDPGHLDAAVMYAGTRLAYAADTGPAEASQ